jgi:ergot alkaloid biosynthesis protein
MRVLVTGGTGKTGRRVAARLRANGHEPVIASRGGGNGVRFDWSEPATYAHAADRIDAAYLVAPSGEFDLIAAMRPFVDTLIDAGVGRLVLLSASSLEPGGPMMGAVHAYLADHAPRWTVLRPSWFMQNFSEQQHRATIVAADAIYSAAGDGKVGWIDADDIAAVAATVLVDSDRSNGDLVLTGPEALNYDAIAAIIGRAVGRTITHRRLTVDQLAARFETAGMPPAYASTLAGMDRAIEAGDGNFVNTTVADLTGAPATSFDRFAHDNRASWHRI